MASQRARCAAMSCLVAFWGVIPGVAEAFLLYESALLGGGRPAALNEWAQVVGDAWYAGVSGPTAVIWERGEPPRDVLGQAGAAYDINDGGAILAGIWGNGRVLITDGGITDLPAMSARALNNLIQVVGYGIWEAGEIRSIDGVSGMDINDRGQVVGYIGGVAVLWDDGTITDISPPNSWGSGAQGMNEAGQAVGWAQIGSRFAHGFFWDGSSAKDLGTLGGLESAANAINDLVQIVGESRAANGEWHACLWEDGAIADLNDLLTEPFPYTLVDAVDINNRGQIACRAVDASGGSWAVLLNPIPEPGALLLLAVGAAAALRRRRLP